MSYNIIYWKTERIEDLWVETKTIPPDEWCAEEFVCEVSEVQGSKSKISNLEMYGIGSGVCWDRVVKMLSSGTGLFVAKITWEDGKVMTLTSKDGKVTEEWGK